MASRYEYVKDLGRGAFGKVVQARDTQGKCDVAIKLLDRSEVSKYTLYEIQNHSKLRHPHVIQFREVFLSPNHINIVLEFANGGSLFDYVQKKGRLREAAARWFFQQLIMAVDYCHKKGVFMRDIKLENTLLEYKPNLARPLLKVCDFGYSKADNRSLPKSQVGTITYMAPEVLMVEAGNDTYDGKAADIWSCGVMLYTMLAGQYPFKGPQDVANASAMQNLANAGMIDMLRRMQRRDYALPDTLGLSADCRDLLDKLLAPKAAERASMLEIMQHPWFIQELPCDAVRMNDKYLASTRTCVQTGEQIETVVKEAMARHTERTAREWSDSRIDAVIAGVRDVA